MRFGIDKDGKPSANTGLHRDDRGPGFYAGYIPGMLVPGASGAVILGLAAAGAGVELSIAHAQRKMANEQAEIMAALKSSDLSKKAKAQLLVWVASLGDNWLKRFILGGRAEGGPMESGAFAGFGRAAVVRSIAEALGVDAETVRDLIDRNEQAAPVAPGTGQAPELGADIPPQTGLEPGTAGMPTPQAEGAGLDVGGGTPPAAEGTRTGIPSENLTPGVGEATPVFEDLNPREMRQLMRDVIERAAETEAVVNPTTGQELIADQILWNRIQEIVGKRVTDPIKDIVLAMNEQMGIDIDWTRIPANARFAIIEGTALPEAADITAAGLRGVTLSRETIAELGRIVGEALNGREGEVYQILRDLNAGRLLAEQMTAEQLQLVLELANR